jgi:WD40 repeat protein
MEQGLGLIVRWLIEFAPVIAVLVQRRDPSELVRSKLQVAGEVGEFVQNVKSAFAKEKPAWGFEQEKALQQQLAAYHRDTQLEIASYQRETALKSSEIDKVLENWPLRLYPSQILEPRTNPGPIPLRIFLAPPQVGGDRAAGSARDIDIELGLAEGLRGFLHEHYSLQDPVRPTEFLAGAWESKRFHGESSIKALFGMLKSEPTLILESEIDGNSLNFRLAYWGFDRQSYYYKTIAKLPYKEIVYKSVKTRALAWKEIRDQLLELGESPEEVDRMGGTNAVNLEILEKEEKWQACGIDVSKLTLQYEVSCEDVDALCQFAIDCHCLVASWIADTYHLIYYDVPPLLPQLLPQLVENAPDPALVQSIVTGYKQIYQVLGERRRCWMPELALQLAQSLLHLPDRSWSREQVDYSMRSWLQLRRVSLPENDKLLEAMIPSLMENDREYIEQLHAYFVALGDDRAVEQAQTLLNAIEDLKNKQNLENLSPLYTLSEHSGKVLSVAIGSDGELLTSSCTDKTIKLWNLRTGELLRTIESNIAKVASVAIAPNGELLVAGGSECPKGNIKVWNLRTGQPLPIVLGIKHPVKFVAIDPTGQILCSGGHKVKLWNLRTGERLRTLWHACAVNSAAISPDGQLLASGLSDGKIKLWNPWTSELYRTLKGHVGEVSSVAIDPDGKFLVSGSADKTIKIWHLSTGELQNTLTGHTGGVTSVAIDPNGHFLVSGSTDKTIKIWHLSTGDLRATLIGHTGGVSSVAIGADGKTLASGSLDKTVKIWQLP